MLSKSGRDLVLAFVKKAYTQAPLQPTGDNNNAASTPGTQPIANQQQSLSNPPSLRRAGRMVNNRTTPFSSDEINTEINTQNSNIPRAGKAGIADYAAKGTVPTAPQSSAGAVRPSANPVHGQVVHDAVGAFGKAGKKFNLASSIAGGDVANSMYEAAKLKVPGVSNLSRIKDTGQRLSQGDLPGAALEMAGMAVPVVPDLINAGRDLYRGVNQQSEENNRFNRVNREVRGSFEARNTGIADHNGQDYVNTEDLELLGKLGFDFSVGEYLGLEKTSEVLDVYSYIEKVAGVPKEVAKLIDSGKAFSGEYLKDMGYKLPKGYEVKGDLCCPVEKKESSRETGKAEKQSSEKPGLWANIRAKRARGEKAAKPGDSDYPDRKQWDKLSKEATTLSALKKLIRQLRSSGVTVTKDPKGYAKIILRRLKKELPDHGTNLSAMTSHIKESVPPSYNGADRVVYIPRKSPESITGQSRAGKLLDKNYRMSDAIMHEGGHALHHLEDPGLHFRQLTENPHAFPSESLALERIANNNAINFMRASNVPGNMIENYKQNFAKPGHGTYRKFMGWNKASKTSPAYSIENPTISSNQIDKLYVPAQDIRDAAIRRFMGKQAVAAWQRSEGKNPEGGLNAKGRASYKKETGGTLKAPVTESNPSGERAKRQNSFCSRMCGMKRKNTGSKGQSDPDSRINKSLRKWNCKCGEAHDSLFEKLACVVKEGKGRCWEGYKPVPGKEPYSEDSCKPENKKKEVKKEAAAPTQQYEGESVRPFGGVAGGMSGGVGLQSQSNPGSNQPALRPIPPQLRPIPTQKAPRPVNPAPGNPAGVTNTTPTMSPGTGNIISTHAPLNVNNISMGGQVTAPSFGEVYGKMKTRPIDFVVGAADIGANLVSPGGSKVVRTLDNIRQGVEASQMLTQNKPNTITEPNALDAIDNIGGVVAGMPYLPAKVIGTGMQLGAKGGRLVKDYDQARAQLPDILTEQPVVPPTNYPSSNFSIRSEQQAQPNVNIDIQSLAKNSEFTRFVEYFNKSAAADHPLVSSNIKAVGHDKKEKVLDVAFHSGGEYKYKDVPRSLYTRLLKAKSPGKFFHKHVKKDKPFEYEKVNKEAEYKWHKSKDLHRDVTNGRHYPFSFLTGEAKELVDAIKNRDMANFKEEVGDTTYAAQMLAAQATGLNHPVYADLSKFYKREKAWKDIFKEKGSTYHPKHMEGGSNFAKASKIIKAFASAGIKINQREAERLANKYTGGKMEKEAADGNELRRLILAAHKGSKSSKQSLSAMGSKKGPRKPRSLPKPSDIAKDSYRERHQGIFPFLGSHQAEIAKNTIDPSYAMDPSRYLGK